MTSSSWLGAVDGNLKVQASADASYFAATCGRRVSEEESQAITASFLKAYHWQYIHSGAQHPRFGEALASTITEDHGRRIQAARETLH